MNKYEIEPVEDPQQAELFVKEKDGSTFLAIKVEEPGAEEGTFYDPVTDGLFSLQTFLDEGWLPYRLSPRGPWERITREEMETLPQGDDLVRLEYVVGSEQSPTYYVQKSEANIPPVDLNLRLYFVSKNGRHFDSLRHSPTAKSWIGIDDGGFYASFSYAEVAEGRWSIISPQ